MYASPRFANVGTSLALSVLLGLAACGSDDDGTPADDGGVTDLGDTGVTADASSPSDGDVPDGFVPDDDGTVPDGDGPTAPKDAAPVDATPPPPDVQAPTQTTFGGNRPTELLVPKGYDPAKPHPLVITLHGYGSDGQTHLDYFGYAQLVDTKKILVVAPDGSNFSGVLGWNSVPEMSSPDDEGYLSSLIAEIKGVYNVGKVFIVGHSAGGFMAYRMACERGDEIHGVLALSTSTFYEDAAECTPARALGVLQIHGTADDQVDYDGGYVVPFNIYYKYPAPETTVSYWAGYNGCTGEAQSVGSLDLDQKIVGAETAREGYACPVGTGVELWTVEGGGHVPDIDSLNFATVTLDWLDKHSTL